MARYRQAFASSAGSGPPDGPFHLFRADVREIWMVRPAGDHLDIDWWRSDTGVKHVERKWRLGSRAAAARSGSTLD
jgi:hypothetical protein